MSLQYALKACGHINLSFNFSIVRPSDEFQGPSQFHVHTPWPSVKFKVTLRSGYLVQLVAL